MVVLRKYLSSQWISTVKVFWGVAALDDPSLFLFFWFLDGYSDGLFPVQKRSSSSSSSLLITWNSGDWDPQLQQVSWEKVFSQQENWEREARNCSWSSACGKWKSIIFLFDILTVSCPLDRAEEFLRVWKSLAGHRITFGKCAVPYSTPQGIGEAGVVE